MRKQPFCTDYSGAKIVRDVALNHRLDGLDDSFFFFNLLVMGGCCDAIVQVEDLVNNLRVLGCEKTTITSEQILRWAIIKHLLVQKGCCCSHGKYVLHQHRVSAVCDSVLYEQEVLL